MCSVCIQSYLALCYKDKSIDILACWIYFGIIPQINFFH